MQFTKLVLVKVLDLEMKKLAKSGLYIADTHDIFTYQNSKYMTTKIKKLTFPTR